MDYIKSIIFVALNAWILSGLLLSSLDLISRNYFTVLHGWV